MMPRDHDEIQDKLAKRFARFGDHALSDADIWALSAATMVMPEGNPGAEAYLTQVGGTDEFVHTLTTWGRVVAQGIAQACYKAPGGSRRRAYVEGYDEAKWGRYAVADGLSLALFGNAPGLVERCEALKCGKQGYQRIRDFVGGALVVALAEYRNALEWATGERRDRLFEGRWEGITGLNWDEARRSAMLDGDKGSHFPMFAPGCAVTRTKSLADDRMEPDPQNVYHGLRPSDWWDEVYAARMRKQCPAVTLYPTSDTPPRC